jgi:hypothetical protein
MSTNHDGPLPNALQQRHAQRMASATVDRPSSGYARDNGAGLQGSINTNVPSPTPHDEAPGYMALSAVLDDAFSQAAHGKGKERHAREDEQFTDQLIIEGAKRFGIGALLFQAYKKSEESQRLEYHRARAELLGAIVYLAAAVITLDMTEVPGK